MYPFLVITGLALTFVLGTFIFSTYRPRRVLVLQYQRGVLFHDGLLKRVVEPGLHWIGGARSISLIDTRLQTFLVPGQEILTIDGLSLKLSLAGEYTIVDPERYILTSVDPSTSLYNYAQQTLREAVAALSFDTILATRQAIHARMLELLTPQAAALGLRLAKIEVRDLILPSDLKRAYAQSITAQKEGAAHLERARAETASLRSLANAARLMQDHPGLLQLRAVQAIESSTGNTIQLGISAELSAKGRSAGEDKSG